MTTPINPLSGGPIQPTTTTTTAKSKSQPASSEQFTVSSDTVSTPKLSFGSLRPLINTQLTNETAVSTAQQTGKQLGNQTLPVVNNRPHVVSNLIDTLQGQGQG
jgi:hypothetical protein